MAASGEALLAVFGLLTTGAASAIFRKVVYQMSAPGWHGEVHMFEKPWFTTFLSTTTCSFCILILRVGWGASFGRTVEVQSAQKQDTEPASESVSIVHRTYSRRGTVKPSPRLPTVGEDRDGELRQPLLEGEAEGCDEEERSCREAESPFSEQAMQQNGDTDGDNDGSSRRSRTARAGRRPAIPYHDTMHPVFYKQGAYGHVTGRKVIRLVAPAVAGHLALILQGIGLQFTSASINQMVSGSCIIFTAALSAAVLKRRLTAYHRAGVLLSLVGVVVVSVSSLLPVEGQASCERPQPVYLTVLGIVITLLSQVVQAVQLVLEELMLRDLHLHPFQVLGYEGVIGMLWMVALAAPILAAVPGMDAGGVQENTLDTLLMMRNSRWLSASVAFYWFTVLGTNLFGVLVTATIGSVFRSVLLTTRTALVWIVDLGLFYSGLGGGVVGEALNRWSVLEAAGFVFLLVGTMVYALGSMYVEKAVEKAVLSAVETSFAAGALRSRGASPNPRSPSAEPGPGAAFAGVSSSNKLLVRQVSGLDSLLKDESTQYLLGRSPDLEAPAREFWQGYDGEAQSRTVVLEGLDSNRHLGSSSFVNPFIPRLPLGENSDVPDILGTSLENDGIEYISPAVTPVGSSPSRRTSIPGADVESAYSSYIRQGESRTTLLLNNVRATLRNDPSVRREPPPSPTGQVAEGSTQSPLSREQEQLLNSRSNRDGVSAGEEEQGCTFHMDG